jgi:hypothetical protein
VGYDSRAKIKKGKLWNNGKIFPDMRGFIKHLRKEGYGLAKEKQLLTQGILSVSGNSEFSSKRPFKLTVIERILEFRCGKTGNKKITWWPALSR